nr:gas vesicle protein GvpJ [Thermoactinospora rubra]
MTVQPAGGGAVERPGSTSLADVIDTILDKGLVIDAYVNVSLVGIQILTVDARVVVASVDTYLRFAEATERLSLGDARGQGVPEMVQGALGGSGGQAALDSGDQTFHEEPEPAREKSEADSEEGTPRRFHERD